MWWAWVFLSSKVSVMLQLFISRGSITSRRILSSSHQNFPKCLIKSCEMSKPDPRTVYLDNHFVALPSPFAKLNLSYGSIHFSFEQPSRKFLHIFASL